MSSTPKILQPHPGVQTLALSRTEFEIGYGGSRGGGKTHAGMLWFLYTTDHPLFRGLVIRKNSVDLEDWIDRASRIYRAVYPSFRFKDNPPVAHFPAGGMIYTGHLKDDRAYEKYQGNEYQRILIEELTQIPDEISYLKLIASCRSTVPDIKPQVFTTFNPGGVGHAWVRKRFVDKCRFKSYKYGVYNPVLKTTIEKSRIFIPARVYDNPTILENDPEYIALLHSIPDDKLRRAWLDGDWDVFSGQFFDRFEPLVHVVKPFDIPSHWKKVMGLDYGNTTIGEAVAIDPSNGNMYVFAEWKAEKKTRSEKAGLLASFLQRHNITDIEVIGDSNMFAIHREAPQESTPAAVFRAANINMRPVSKRSPDNTNFRVWANDRIKDLLFWEMDDNNNIVRNPKVYFLEGKCPTLIETLPLLQYDEYNPEDIADDDNDHAYDAFKYAVVSASTPQSSHREIEQIRNQIIEVSMARPF